MWKPKAKHWRILFEYFFTGEDDSDLFLEEREGALKKAQDEKRKIQIAVPGILNPHEMPEEMQEMWAPETELKLVGQPEKEICNK